MSWYRHSITLNDFEEQVLQHLISQAKMSAGEYLGTALLKSHIAVSDYERLSRRLDNLTPTTLLKMLVLQSKVQANMSVEDNMVFHRLAKIPEQIEHIINTLEDDKSAAKLLFNNFISDFIEMYKYYSRISKSHHDK